MLPSLAILIPPLFTHHRPSPSFHTLLLRVSSRHSLLQPSSSERKASSIDIPRRLSTARYSSTTPGINVRAPRSSLSFPHAVFHRDTPFSFKTSTPRSTDPRKKTRSCLADLLLGGARQLELSVWRSFRWLKRCYCIEIFRCVRGRSARLLNLLAAIWKKGFGCSREIIARMKMVSLYGILVQPGQI